MRVRWRPAKVVAAGALVAAFLATAHTASAAAPAETGSLIGAAPLQPSIISAFTTIPPPPVTNSTETTGAATFTPRQFTVLGAGDILLHQRLWTQARANAHARGQSGYDFDPIFASAVPDIRDASLAICHVETPYGKANGPFTGYPIFEVPPAIARTIHNVGYDSCSTASNHSLDGGLAGIDRTLDALDAAGVKHTGTARSAAEASRIQVYR